MLSAEPSRFVVVKEGGGRGGRLSVWNPVCILENISR